MHPADEFFHLKQQIRDLTGRANRMRAQFLSGDLPVQSNAHNVIIRQQTRRVFKRDRLPPEVLADPRYWQEARSSVVSVSDPISHLSEEDLDVLENW
jgi:hypothetical protein